MDGLRISMGSDMLKSADGLKEVALQRNQINTNAPSVGDSFADSLKSAIATVDQLQKTADVKMQELATGKSQNIHETMIAAEKADLALRLMVQVRNKVIDAYQEILKMQV